MELSQLSTTVPAKVIYAGEHAVVRGGHAVVAPHLGAFLKLSYCPDTKEQDSSLLLRQNVDQLLQRIQRPKLPGTFQVTSSIPEAAGLGSSAALSVAFVRLLDQIDGRTSSDHELLVRAKEFENHFHGTSSGLDPAGVISPYPVLFQRDQGIIEHLTSPLQVDVRLIDSGLRAKTNEVSERVKLHFQDDAAGLKTVDLKMNEAVDLLVRAFKTPNQKQSVDLWVESFEVSHTCFVNYGLVDSKLVEQRNRILDGGALSAKLTGKGLGGFWLAIYPKST